MGVVMPMDRVAAREHNGALLYVAEHTRARTDMKTIKNPIAPCCVVGG